MTRLLWLFIAIVVTPIVISSQSYAADTDIDSFYMSDDYLVYGAKAEFMSNKMYECRFVIRSNDFETIFSSLSYNKLKSYVMVDVLFNQGVYASKFVADVGDGEPVKSDNYMPDMKAGFLFVPVGNLDELTAFKELTVTAFNGRKNTKNVIDLSEYPQALGAFKECIATMN